MVELLIARRLCRELSSAAALVEAGDPDAPAWEAEARARRLVASLTAVLAVVRSRRRPLSALASGPIRRGAVL